MSTRSKALEPARLRMGLASALVAAASGAVLGADGSPLWDYDGVHIASPVGKQRFYAHISDGAGGTIIAWEDEMNLTPGSLRSDVLVQRIDSDGNRLWGDTGVLLSSYNNSEWAALTTDDNGGAIVAWKSDTGSGPRVFAQRVNASGVKQWASPVALNDSGYTSITQPVICRDGYGGAMIGFGARLAQINASGVVQSPGVNGIEVIPGGSGTFQLCRGTLGGIFCVWLKAATGELYAQKYVAGPMWGASGALVSTDTNTAKGFDIAPDGSSGLLVTWAGAYPQAQVHAQRLDGSATKLWGSAGVVVVDEAVVGGYSYNWASYMETPDIAPDAYGGALVAWNDWRHSTSTNFDDEAYAQRLNATGVPQWAANGVLLPPYVVGSTAPGSQRHVRIVGDGLGGAITTCQDLGGWSWDITATRVSASGVKLWSRYVIWDGTSPSDPGETQKWPEIVFDASGSAPTGAVIAWTTDDDTFVQKMEVSASSPANNSCASAITVVPGTYHGSFFLATADGQSTCGPSSVPDVWYKITPPYNCTLTTSTCGTVAAGSGRTVISWHTACPGTAGNEIACNDDAPVFCGVGKDDDASIRDAVRHGIPIYIRVAAQDPGVAGPFVLNVSVEGGVEPDFDFDGDVDLSDFATFMTCFNGPNRPPAQAHCESSDFDNDSDVDLADFSVFLTCFNGPARPPACP